MTMKRETHGEIETKSDTIWSGRNIKSTDTHPRGSKEIAQSYRLNNRRSGYDHSQGSDDLPKKYKLNNRRFGYRHYGSKDLPKKI